MPPAIASLTTRLYGASSAGRGHAARAGLLLGLHLAALAILFGTESGPVSQLAFVLGWGFFNFCWIALLRRPAVAAAISLAWLVLLIVLSQLKQSILFMTVNFVDLMVVDPDTVRFLLTVYPGLPRDVALAALVTVTLLGAIWWVDPLRMRFRAALLGALLCAAGLVAVATAVPSDPEA